VGATGWAFCGVGDLVWWAGEKAGGCVVGQTEWVAVGADEAEGGFGRVCKVVDCRCGELAQKCKDGVLG
jgi:hypothetical protein